MMNKPSEKHSSALTKLLKRTGGWYYLVTILLSQLIAYPGSLLGGFVIQLNAQFTQEQYTKSIAASLTLLTLGHILLLIGAYLSNKDFFIRINQWKNNVAMSGGVIEENAWKQATSLAWRYGATALAVSIGIDIIPLLIYQYALLGATRDQLIYTFFGSVGSAIVILIVAVLLIENMLQPTRTILLPEKFENQLGGATSIRLLQKFLVVILALLLLSILLVAPIGYQKTYTVLYHEIGSTTILQELQVQSIAASVVTLLLGTFLAFLLSISVERPLRNMIEVFGLIEKGDLKNRATVTATDEIGELAVYFNRMLSRLEELQENLEKRVAEQTAHLRASNEVGRIASTILDPDELVTRVVQLITESFGYYYSSIFIVDDSGRWAVLKEATGTAGEALKARRHRLQVGGTSMVGTAITTKEPQIALDVGVAAVHFNNPLLPNTRSEAAIPLLVGEKAIGALDVQSTKEAEFKMEEISTLQSMANQVAIAIENARLFKEMDQALEELQQSNRQYIVSAWSEKLKSGRLEYSTKATLPPISQDEKSHEVEVNMNLRDEIIGQIRLETEGEWTSDDQAWVESLATQVAISLENARLVEESQQSALRERLAASIVQKLWSSNSIDTIMQTTVRELGRALEASEVTIELNAEE